MYTIDIKNRRIIIQSEGSTTYSECIINEFDKLERIFLDGTKEKYECEMILLEVEKHDEFGKKSVEKEIKAFARRIGRPDWLMIFNEKEYII